MNRDHHDTPAERAEGRQTPLRASPSAERATGSGDHEQVPDDPANRRSDEPGRVGDVVGEAVGAAIGEDVTDETADDEAKSSKRPVRFALKTIVFALVFYFFILPFVPRFVAAADEIQRVQPIWLVLGVTLQLAALYAYAVMTRAAIGEAGEHLSSMRMFRIQMSTKALSHVVPAGSAAGSALGYRLLTLSGISGPNAGFAMAASSLGAAVVLNFIVWAGLLVSIPIRGVNPIYASAALAGVIIMMIAGFLVVGLLQGRERSEIILRWLAKRARFDEDRAAAALHEVAHRINDLTTDRQLLKKVVLWSVARWLLDAASLWVFIRAFGPTFEPDALIIAFGVANLIAVLPVTPGGIGIVDATYLSMLTGFGLGAGTASLAVASYRIVQFFFPILFGGVLYLSLRVGPWRIERREELRRLRDLAAADETSETTIDFALRFHREELDAEGETGSGDLARRRRGPSDEGDEYPHNPT